MSDDDRTRQLRGNRDLVDGETLPFEGEPPAPPAGELARGTAIGRYLVLDTLGRGGMGVVYRAYDPELDRKIAVKVLRTGERDGSAGRVRMQREAQALARLPHPNVIAVHDVGAIGAGVFIAMELVEGGTMRAWQERRSWREVLAAYLAAGRGLAAAHAAGLVHRDFKPENVLIGDDGRARVTDFGLVRAVTPTTGPIADGSGDRAAQIVDDTAPTLPPPGTKISTGSRPGSTPMSSDLTVAGAVMGTPMYMAPEQLAGQSADPRSDQFALCVAVWEALYGARPFAGDDTATVAAAIQAGPPRPPASSPVPRAIGRALARGLAFDPAARWPAMDALLDALAREAGGRRRRAIAIAIAGGVVVAAAAATTLVMVRSGGGDTCAAATRAIDPLWTADSRGAVARAFTATGAPFASEAVAGVDRAVGAWASRWRTIARTSCRDTRIGHVQSESLLDLRTACLDERLARTQGLIEALGHADRALVEHAVQRITTDLPDLDVCNDVAALTGRAPVPAADRDRVAALDQQIAALDGAAMAASTATAARALVPRARQLIADARAIGWQPDIAKALKAASRVDGHAGDGKAARTELVDAIGAATAGGDREMAAAALIALVEIDAQVNSDYDGADRWATLADGALTQLANPLHARERLLFARGTTAKLRSHFGDADQLFTQALAISDQQHRDEDAVDDLDQLAQVATGDGRYDDAARWLDRALPLSVTVFGADHPHHASLLHDLGNLEVWRGHYPAALTAYRQALAIREEALGKDSPEVATTLDSMAIAEIYVGATQDALAHELRALDVLERHYGKDHVEVAVVLNGLGGIYHAMGDHQRALDANLRALAIREHALGPDHADVAYSLVNAALEEKHLGHLDTGEARFRRALAIFDASIGADNPTTGIAHLNFAELLRVAGRLDESAGEYAAARRILTKAMGADHPVLAHVNNGEGQLALARGKPADARPLLERAVTERVKTGDPPDLAESRFALARTLALLGVDAARGHTLAVDARDAWAKLPDHAAERAAADAWLRAHGGSSRSP